MKYVLYTFFFTFIITLIYFLKTALHRSDEPVEITGSEKCARCHALNITGNQYDKWKNESHAKAYLSLLSEKAVSLTSRSGINPPDRNELCLKCHTTKYFLNFPVSLSYSINEGIGCEACHGAGSRYYAAEKHSNRDEFLQNGGIVPDEKICLQCHSLKGNPLMEIKDNICPFQYHDFNFSNTIEKIKHPLNKKND